MQAQEIKIVFDNWGMVGVAVLAGASLVAIGVVAWTKKFAEAAVERELASEMETIKARLQLSTDAARLDLQRQLHDFTLYSSRRRDWYERIYRALLMAEGAAGEGIGFTLGVDLSGASVGQIRDEFATARLPQEDLDELLGLWETDRPQALNRFHALKERVSINRARRLHRQAMNQSLMGQLYQSVEVSVAIDKAAQSIWKVIAFRTWPELYSHENPAMLKIEATAAVIGLRDAMQRDISRGDYGNVLVTGDQLGAGRG